MTKQHTKIAGGKRIWTTDSLLTLEGGDHVEIFDLLVYSFLEIGFTQHSYAHYTLEDLEIKLYNDSVGIFKTKNFSSHPSRQVYYRAEGMRDFWGVVREVWEGI